MGSIDVWNAPEYIDIPVFTRVTQGPKAMRMPGGKGCPLRMPEVPLAIENPSKFARLLLWPAFATGIWEEATGRKEALQ